MRRGIFSLDWSTLMMPRLRLVSFVSFRNNLGPCFCFISLNYAILFNFMLNDISLPLVQLNLLTVLQTIKALNVPVTLERQFLFVLFNLGSF